MYVVCTIVEPAVWVLAWLPLPCSPPSFFLPSQWLILRIFVQKVFETNLNFWYILKSKISEERRDNCYVNFKSWCKDCAFIFSDFLLTATKNWDLFQIFFWQKSQKAVIVPSLNPSTYFEGQHIWSNWHVWILGKNILHYCFVIQHLRCFPLLFMSLLLFFQSEQCQKLLANKLLVINTK